jgi:hypothetical protein
VTDPTLPDGQPEAAGPASPPAPALDPEDWASSAGAADDDRYLTERPPHWQ